MVILLERPSLKELDPLEDRRLSKFSLRLVQNGQTTDQDAFRGSESDLIVGNVPTGTSFDLRLAGKTAADEMLGLGMVLDARAAESEETTVALKFRKPMAYVAQGSGLLPLDVTGDGESPERGFVSIAGVIDTAALPNGVFVLALAGNKVVPVGSDDHKPHSPATLDAAGSCIAVSPDSRYALVCHASPSGVSVVDLSLVEEGSLVGVKTDLPGGEPSRIAFGTDRKTAWLLMNAYRSTKGCSGKASELVELEVPSMSVRQRVALKEPVADIAVDPRDGKVLLAMPCPATDQGGALGRWTGDSEEVVAKVPVPYDLALTDQSIVMLSAEAISGAVSTAARITAFDLTKPGFVSTQTGSLPLPPLQLYFKSQNNSTGYVAWVSEATGLAIRDLAVAPDGRRAAALFDVEFGSNQSLAADCLFASKVKASGYMLLDLVSASLLDIHYTRMDFSTCSANCIGDSSGSLAAFQKCQSTLKDLLRRVKLLSSQDTDATSITLLFGGG